MAKGIRFMISIVLILSLLLSGVGYATLTDSLAVNGSANAEAPETVYIYNADNVDGLSSIYYGDPDGGTAGTAVFAEVQFNNEGKAVIDVDVFNNSGEEYMYYGVLISPIADSTVTYTAEVTKSDGSEYKITVDGVESDKTNAVEGERIANGEKHERLRVTLTSTGGATEGGVAFSLFYQPASKWNDWTSTSYTIEFFDGLNELNVSVNGTPLGTNKIVVDIGTGYDLSTVEPTTIPDKQAFNGWKNAMGAAVTEIQADNENDYALYVTWSNKFTIHFFEDEGNLLYAMDFDPDGNPSIPSDKLVELDDYLNNDENGLNTTAGSNDLVASWPNWGTNGEGYDNLMANATGDIYIRPTWTYLGTASLTPKDNDGDGVVDEYYVEGLKDTTSTDHVTVYIPPEVNGVKVTQIANNGLNGNPNLADIFVPNTITDIGADAFIAYAGIFGKKETVQIYYDGTKAEWDAITKNSNWDRNLGNTSVISCCDGTYTKSWFGWSWADNDIHDYRYVDKDGNARTWTYPHEEELREQGLIS